MKLVMKKIKNKIFLFEFLVRDVFEAEGDDKATWLL